MGRNVFEAIFPRTCEVCGRSLLPQEKLLCLHCMMEFPAARPDEAWRRLASMVQIERAASWMSYGAGDRYSELIRRGKYYGRPGILRDMARRYATQLMREGFFDGMDAIVAVPMSAAKLRRRGYNQADHIARGVSDATGIAVLEGGLYTLREHSTQTAYSSESRRLNAVGLYSFALPSGVAAPEHVLVVDDVMTTGSTILACSEAIKAGLPTARVSAFTLAIASM